MPMITFSEDDLLRGKVVEPAWYRVKIVSTGEAPSKNLESPSTNYPMEARILYNADSGDKTFANVPISWMFNSKAPGFMTGFFASFGVDVKAGARYDLNATVDKEIEMFIKNDTYDGRIINRVDHKYRPVRS